MTGFNPRLPCGRRLHVGGVAHGVRRFNPRLPCGRRLGALDHHLALLVVSIHASRVGGDQCPGHGFGRGRCFNPRLPCGRRPIRRWESVSLANVSIHASRVGGDAPPRSSSRRKKFQSTPPVWEATICKVLQRASARVSIHASRVGGDRSVSGMVIILTCFNPRLPCGRRRALDVTLGEDTGFNPRLPCGRRPSWASLRSSSMGFQSTPPVWEATRRRKDLLPALRVSIHASRVGGDSARP